MVFEIDSDLVPIDAEHVTIEGFGIAVDWTAGREPAVGWSVGRLRVEKP